MFPRAFDPAVRAWFQARFAAPTPCQERAWAALAESRHTLVAAPTGSGKTLAAFLTAISRLVSDARRGTLEQRTHVLYVSPLKALSNDVRLNLEQPLAEIGAALAKEMDDGEGAAPPSIQVAVRTGDTPQAVRALMRKRHPHILVTTPESLYILLTSDSGREMLAGVESVIVDEIHALVGSKRGAHLGLSLARLDRLCKKPPVRVGLSATQRPIARVAEFLTGQAENAAEPAQACQIIDEGHVRDRDLAIEMPASPLETVLSAETAGEIRARMCQLIESHRTTLIFVNTRRMAERLARALADELGEDAVCAHHGSMARERRLDAEQRLKRGALRALVATASLELGIDIGDVDLVCQLGTTRTLAMLLQRVGRSGHAVGGQAKGRLFPQTRDELLECVTLLDMVRRDELDTVTIPGGALDVLAQHIVAETACDDYDLDELFELCCRAWSYRDLGRPDFDRVINMLSEGYAFARGRQSAFLHVDRVNQRVRGRRQSRLVAITCGGAIPDTADYDVIAEPHGDMVGTVNEDFAIESLPGNVFQLGNTSWRVLRVESSAVRVEDAAGEPPNMPFWLGEAPARSSEFSAAVSRLRAELATLCAAPGAGTQLLADHLAEIPGVGRVAAHQAADYVLGGYRALGVVPTQETLVLERFFDESGGMQLVIHSPFGSRLNKAWGLALRKRFCRTFNFELQAAALEDAIVISLGAVHSFPLEEVWRYLSAASVRDVLVQALLDAPMFTLRWRWVAACALAIQRFRGGRKTPPRLLRMQADDLVAVVFPDQLACAENLSGRRDVPDHPLVQQAIEDCLHEAMDIDALETLISAIENGSKKLICKDLTEPSPFALQVLNANPYAFLDDAPLEERRTQAVSARRWLDPATASDLGQLDVAAIRRVHDEVWPQPRDDDELHEAVVLLGFLPESELPGLGDVSALKRGLERLGANGRVQAVASPARGWCATERGRELALLWPDCPHLGDLPLFNADSEAMAGPEAALEAMVRGRMEMCGPTTVADLARCFAQGENAIAAALLSLEQRGVILRGSFNPELAGEQWCDRRLLARIHRYTLGRLRQEIEPVNGAVFMRFLLDWQHVSAATRVEGAAALAGLVEQFAGFEAPAGAWERYLLPQRMRAYQGTMLDDQIRAGRIAWLRLTPKKTAGPGRANGTLRNTPLALVPRAQLRAWLATVPFEPPAALSSTAAAVRDAIADTGAAFFDDILAVSQLLPAQVESALDELAAAGCVTCDSYAGLRALTAPATERNSSGRRTRRTTVAGIDEAGRWDLVKRPPDSGQNLSEETLETVARALLRRYGVVFRTVLERENGLPPWRHLLWTLRRLEARGEIRGGRFVAGHSGEQFALPEAVSALREMRKQETWQRIDVVNASDPLNLVGVIIPGVRIPATIGNQLAFVDGEFAGMRQGNDFHIPTNLESGLATKVRTALVDRAPARAARGTRRRWR